MKTSTQIWEECEDILKLLKACIEENGWKARYLRSCSDLSAKYAHCNLKHFEQKRLEHNRESRM